ncbi:hypothetical protein JXJ21_19100 [candidate division KSB1 bacterium]|nr:hypothetical protein [candidate division KSB1 bacterium]
MKNTKHNFRISRALTELTERQISYLDQEVAEGKAWELYCNGQVIQPTVFENRLSGIVIDESEQYFVETKVEKNQIIATCNCGIRGQVCRHAVALLHCWISDGDGFQDVGNSLRMLETKDKQELLEIISRMIVKNPQNIACCADEDLVYDESLDLDSFLSVHDDN